MPRPLTDLVRDPLGAQAVVYALLLDADESVRKTQYAWLARNALPAAVLETRKVEAAAQALAPEARLPLVELASPALCEMTPAQFRDFFYSVEALVQADHKMTLFEYALRRLLMRHVVSHYIRGKPVPVKYTNYPSLVRPASVVLSALAHAGQADSDKVARAFEAGVQALDWPGAQLELVAPGAAGLRELDGALETLAMAAPMLKKQILEACAAVICIDGTVTVEEGELLRAISDCLGCPMPPLLPT
jgi:hypothetical protein